MAFWITTSDETRRGRWEHIFGMGHLPVKTAAPRVRYIQDGEILAYDLDAGRLSDAQVSRYAGVLSMRQGMVYAEALYAIRSGEVTIPAEGTEQIELVEPATADPSTNSGERPSFLSAWLKTSFAWLKSLFLVDEVVYG